MKIIETSEERFFWTSDLHFGHRNIVQYTNRGVDTTQEEHDEWLIDLWNKQVRKTDTVFHLGDFVFNCRKIERFKEVVDRLNGRIIMMRGNHDTREVYDKSGLTWYDLKSASIKDGLGINSTQIVMCHYPMAVWNGSHHGTWMLHGHSHGSYNPPKGKILDVGLDNAYNVLGEHRFFTTEDLFKFMSEREVDFQDHHGTHTNQ